jgi:hypothetical protein
MVAALHSYTHPTWLRFRGSGSLMWSRVIVHGIIYHIICGLVHALLPLLCGHCLLRQHCCLAVLASSPSLHCVATLVMLALLPSLCCVIIFLRHCLPHCPQHSSGIIALIPLASSFVLASSPLLCWCCHPHCADIFCPHHTAVVAIVVMSLLSSSR